MGRYTLRARVEADTADQLAAALLAIGHEIEHDHDLTREGEVVSTFCFNGDGDRSWTVTVDHDTDEKIDA